MKALPLLLSALSLVPALSQQPDEPVDPKQLATLEGSVLNAFSGQPLAKVQLTLRPNLQSGARSGPPQPMPGYVAVTDASGKFVIEGIEPGKYNLHAERQGFVGIQYGARLPQSPGTILNLTAGLAVKELNFKLTPHAILTGRITSDDGEPIHKAQVQVLRQVRSQGKRRLVPVTFTESNDLGEFRAAGIGPGRYYVAAQVQHSYRNFQEMILRNAPNEEYPRTFFPSTTDESSARILEISGGQTLNGIDIRIKKTPVFHIRGKVTGVAPPVTNIRVSAIPRNSSFITGSLFGPGGNTAKDGTFDLPSLAPGAYELLVIQTQGAFRATGRQVIQISDSHVEGVQIDASQSVTLQGKVRIEGDPKEVESKLGRKPTLDSARIYFTSLEGIGFNNPSGALDAEGNFKIESASLDRFRPMIQPLPSGLYLKEIQIGGQDVTSTGLDLTSGQAGPIEIILAAGTATISGQILNEKKDPIEGATVSILPEPFQEDRFELIRVVTTDQKGNFQLADLTPGEYRAYAWEAFDMGAQLDPEVLKKHVDQSKRITLKPSEAKTMNLVAIP